MKRVEALRPPRPPELSSKLPRLASPRQFKVKAAVSCDLVFLEGRQIADELAIERSQVKILQEKIRVMMLLLKRDEIIDPHLIAQIQEASDEKDRLDNEFDEICRTFSKEYSDSLNEEISSSRKTVRANQELLKSLQAQIDSNSQTISSILSSEEYASAIAQENRIKELNRKLSELAKEEEKAIQEHQLIIDDDPQILRLNNRMVELQKRLDDLALTRSVKVTELADLRRARSRRDVGQTRNRNERAKSRRKMAPKDQRSLEKRSPRRLTEPGPSDPSSPRNQSRRATDAGDHCFDAGPVRNGGGALDVMTDCVTQVSNRVTFDADTYM